MCVTPAEGTPRWGNHLGSTQMEIGLLPLPGGLSWFSLGLTHRGTKRGHASHPRPSAAAPRRNVSVGSPAVGQSRRGRKRWEMSGSERGHSHGTAAARKGVVNRVDFGSFSYLGFLLFRLPRPTDGMSQCMAQHGTAPLRSHSPPEPNAAPFPPRGYGSGGTGTCGSHWGRRQFGATRRHKAKPGRRAAGNPEPTPTSPSAFPKPTAPGGATLTLGLGMRLSGCPWPPKPPAAHIPARCPLPTRAHPHPGPLPPPPAPYPSRRPSRAAPAAPPPPRGPSPSPSPCPSRPAPLPAPGPPPAQPPPRSRTTLQVKVRFIEFCFPLVKVP